MNKNNLKPENGKNHNVILTVATSLILIACALFTLSVYKHNNVKAVSGMDSVTSVNTPAPEDTGSQPDDTGTGSVTTGTDTSTGTGSGTTDEENQEDYGIENMNSGSSNELRGVWIAFFYQPGKNHV